MIKRCESVEELYGSLKQEYLGVQDQLEKMNKDKIRMEKEAIRLKLMIKNQ